MPSPETSEISIPSLDAGRLFAATVGDQSATVGGAIDKSGGKPTAVDRWNHARARAQHWRAAREKAQDALKQARARLARGTGFGAWVRSVDRLVAIQLRIARCLRLYVAYAAKAARLRPAARLAQIVARDGLLTREAPRAGNVEPEERNRYGMPLTASERKRLAVLRARLKPKDQPVDSGTGHAVAIRARIDVGGTATKFKGSKSSKQLLADLPLPAPPPPRPGLEHLRYGIDYQVIDDLVARAAGAQERASEWTADMVDRRLADAYDVLFRLPINERPRGYGSGSFEYVHEFADMTGRLIDDESPPFKLPPTKAEHSAMDEAMAWLRFVAVDNPRMAKLVGLGAMWKARGGLSKKRCRRFGYFSIVAFEGARADGLERIAAALNQGRSVPNELPKHATEHNGAREASQSRLPDQDHGRRVKRKARAGKADEAQRRTQEKQQRRLPAVRGQSLRSNGQGRAC